jgi:hypothetical protein
MSYLVVRYSWFSRIGKVAKNHINVRVVFDVGCWLRSFCRAAGVVIEPKEIVGSCNRMAYTFFLMLDLTTLIHKVLSRSNCIYFMKASSSYKIFLKIYLDCEVHREFHQMSHAVKYIRFVSLKYKVWGFHSVTMKNTVFWDIKPQFIPYKKRHVSATDPSQLMLYKIWGFHCNDYEECRILGCTPCVLVRTDFPSSLILFTLMMWATRSSETSTHKSHTAPHPRRRHSSLWYGKQQ